VECIRGCGGRLLHPCQGTFKLNNVQIEVACIYPLEAAILYRKIVFYIGEGTPEGQEEIAQIGLGLGFGGVGPELESYVLAELGGIPMQEEIREQGLQPRCVDRGYEGIASE
jgi:hypothetical protein